MYNLSIFPFIDNAFDLKPKKSALSYIWKIFFSFTYEFCGFVLFKPVIHFVLISVYSMRLAWSLFLKFVLILVKYTKNYPFKNF